MEGRARALESTLEEEIEAEAEGLLGTFPPDRYLAALEADERPGLYQYLPQEPAAWCARIEELGGAELLERYQRLLMARLLVQCEPRLAVSDLPLSVQALVRQYLEASLELLEKPRAGYYRPNNDAFLKQLCVGRHRLIPCGPELVDPISGVPKSVLFFGPFGQRARAVAFLLFRAGGLSPFYTLHTDRLLMGRLNEEDYGECYERVADLLEANPEMKGLMGKSWFYDPVLEEISPELAFLGREPVEGGALRLREGPSDAAKSAALRFAPKRKALYDEGRYEPTDYWLIWHRDDLIRWVRG